MQFRAEPFTIIPDCLNIASWRTRRPKAGWSPNPTLPLDEALPAGWSERHVNAGQAFGPHAFFDNACRIANYAPRPHDEPLLFKLAQSLVERLLSHSELIDGARFLRFDFPKVYRDTTILPPWTSGHSSGCALLGLSSLIARFGCEEHKALAQQFLFGMQRVRQKPRQSEWWVTFVDEAGFLWIEEYPLSSDPQPRVLNGHIRGITGLYHYWNVARCDNALALLQGAITTVKHYAGLYRRKGKVNWYELREPRKADYGPKRTVIQQNELFAMTGDPYFKKMACLFSNDMAALL